MRVYRDIPVLVAKPRQLVIGNLDGMHRGHQALIETARLADPAATLTVMTFEPHPKDYFKQSAPNRLMRLNEKLRFLRDQGVDEVVVVRFNQDFAAQTGEVFANVLKTQLKVTGVVVGEGFRFGHRQSGNISHLQAVGLQVVSVPSQLQAGVRISSTRVREALLSGSMTEAQTLLGHPLWLRGRVFKGQQLGRQLGFPTANLAWFKKRLPLSGIYAVRVRIGQNHQLLDAVASLGERPTVNGRGIWLEVHLFDYSGDLYGRWLSVELVSKLRDELKFESLERLIEQMHVDARAARMVLKPTSLG